jgi:hypothetical protein
MIKNSQLYQLMNENLPNISYQKRLQYRTTKKEVLKFYKIINQEIFDNTLPIPKIEVMARCRKYWGCCIADDFHPNLANNKSECIIRLSDKWFCKQWLIATLAHEMCHQYQWDVESRKRAKLGMEPIMSHGPTFFIYKEILSRHGIQLKKSYGMKRWFLYQNFKKC